MHGVVKPEKYYRDKLLDEIVNFIYKQHQIIDILLAGDLNSQIHEEDIQKFFNRTGLYDVFSYYHDISEHLREPTFIRGPKCMDTLEATTGILDYFEGIRLINFSEIIHTDH